MQILDDCIDLIDIHPLDFLRKHHNEVCLLTQIVNYPSRLPAKGTFQTLWLSKHVFVIHAPQHREKFGCVLPDLNQQSPVSSKIYVQVIRNLLGGLTQMIYHHTIW